MSSPTNGRFFSANFFPHSSFDAIKDGIQFTNAQFVSRHICAQNCVTFSEPTGRYDTIISAPESLIAFLISSEICSSVLLLLIGFTLFSTQIPTPSRTGLSKTLALVLGILSLGTQSTIFGDS